MNVTRDSAHATRLKIGPQGRIVIPRELRRALGLQPGDSLVAWIENDRIVLRPRDSVERELWEMFDKVEGSLAAELIGERRLEAQYENRT